MKMTNCQRAALIVLWVRGGAVLNTEMMELAGITLTGKDRVGLTTAGLVTGEKAGRTFAHELTAAGRAWCVGELGAPVPPAAGALGGALYVLLGGLNGGWRPGTGENPPPAAEDRGSADRTAVPAPDAVPPLERQVRDAYVGLADDPSWADWVSVTDLRSRMSGTREEQDAELLRLSRLPDVHLAPEPDQRQLTPADRAAAVTIGGKPNHLIKVDPPSTEGLIRSAYDQLAPAPRDWVRLADLRSAVDAPRAQVDDAIKRLSRSQQATLAPVQDQRTLTSADEDAAIRLGGESKHLVSIG